MDEHARLGEDFGRIGGVMKRMIDFIRVFVSFVFRRDFTGGRISIKTAFEVSKILSKPIF